KAAWDARSEGTTVVAHELPAPEITPSQSPGNSGTITELKSSAKATVGRPSDKLNATVPRSLVPSSRCSTGVRRPPQLPLAVKVKACVAAIPPAASAPKLLGPVGNVTPPVASRVANRLVVSTLPRFRSPNLTVTVSPGSMAPFGGRHPS